MYRLSTASKGHLEGVHPDLVRVVLRAITLTRTDFGVVCGVRDFETQKIHVASGNSTTLNSLHLIQEDGYSHAVDLCCYDFQGRPTNDRKYWNLVVQAMNTAAIIEGVPIKCGALWHSFYDAAHFELDDQFWPLKEGSDATR